MRTEKEMYNLFLNIAKNDERIRAVYINGSRTNPNVPKDIFQDYDVVYVVTETTAFIDDKAWIKRFGEILYMQYPDEHPDYPSDKENFYGWLMQFTDGNRIDLHVETISHAQENVMNDSLCKVLLDKDNCLPELPPSSDKNYWIHNPTLEQYLCTCSEFWWCLNSVAKGLWREEIPYVQDMLNFVVRKQLEKMLSWKVGIITNFSVSVGKSAKYMYKWLSAQEWEKYLHTYCGADVYSIWQSVEFMCSLFEETATWVAEELNYKYNDTEANNSMYFLKTVKNLPKDTSEIL
ncbi:MAG: aminoglycoside 6-adenylyltransferase [Lachnospiraceae bacterium]|nr:aminoglycoside 6-adenylyltransferase [Lachnospiraceae bacterium]